MPENAPAVKRRATERFGPSSVTVYTCASTQAAREEECERVRLETAAVLAPPYDHFFTMAGQGTIALEFLAQVPTLDCIIVPVGGGGMLSGIALAAKSLRPSIKIVCFPFSVAPLFLPHARILSTGPDGCLIRPFSCPPQSLSLDCTLLPLLPNVFFL